MKELINKIKALDTICKACGECMITLHTDGETSLRCTEYNAEQVLYKNVTNCSAFFFSRDLSSDITTKQKEEVEKYFKFSIFKE